MRQIIPALVLLITISAIASLTSAVFIETSLDTALNDSQFSEVIVQFNDVNQTNPHAPSFESNELSNYTVTRRFSRFNGAVLKIKKKDLQKLRNSRRIKAIHANKNFHGLLTQSIPLTNSTVIFGRRPTGINSTGIGQSVCVIDSGVNYNNPSLGNGCYGPGCKVIAGWDFVNNDADPLDDNGHGTHVAGIIAANGAVTGIAPGANIVAVKVLNAAGQGTFANLLSGIDWCNDNAAAYNISAISISIGDGAQNQPADAICTAFDNLFLTARNLGIFVAVSSGNDGFANGINAPACSQYAVSVGATYDANLGVLAWGSPVTCTENAVLNNVTCFTDRSPVLKLLAPGALITSTSGLTTATLGGTSQAAPHVAGIAALIFSDQKNERGYASTPVELLNALMATGTSTQDPLNALQFYPRVNAYRALLALDNTSAQILTVNYTNNSWTNKTSITTVFNLNEFANCAYTVNNTTTQASNNLTISVTFDTQITNQNVTLTCTDQANNNGTSILFFRTDFTAPNSTTQTPPALLNISSNLTVIPSDTGGSNVQITYYCIDVSGTCNPLEANGIQNGNNNSQNEFNITLDSSLSGELNISVISIDTAGNIQNANRTNFTVNTKPTLTSASVSSTTLQGGESITIYTQSSDANAQNVTITICTTNSPCLNTPENRLCINTSSANTNCTYITPVEDASKTIYVFAFDEFNQPAETNETLTYETSIVTPQIYNLTITNITKTTIELNFATSKTVTFNFSYDSQETPLNFNYTNNTLSQNHYANLTQLNEQTTYYYNLTVIDAFGNQNNTTGQFITGNQTNYTLESNITFELNYTIQNLLLSAINPNEISFNITISNPISDINLGNYTYSQTQWEIINNTNYDETQFNATFNYNATLVNELNINETSIEIFKLNENTNEWELQLTTLDANTKSLFLENANPARYALGGLLIDNQTCTYNNQCNSNKCAQDYDDATKVCASNNYCNHNNYANYTSATCYNSNAYTCTESNWVQTICTNGCTNGTCNAAIRSQSSSTGGGGGASSITPSPVKPITSNPVTPQDHAPSEATREIPKLDKEPIFRPNNAPAAEDFQAKTSVENAKLPVQIDPTLIVIITSAIIAAIAIAVIKKNK